MNDAINRLNLPWDQARVLRQVRDCGCIRIRDGQHVIWSGALGLRDKGLTSISVSPNHLYADIRISEAGRAIAG